VQPRHLTILLFFVLAAFFIRMPAGAQTTSKELQKYPPAALKKDFSLLRETLQKKHPGLYRYKSKEVMDALLDSCYRSIHAQADLERHTRLFPLRMFNYRMRLNWRGLTMGLLV
jgi:hypothetical protein